MRGATLESVQAGFASSAEFLADNNSDYVQGLYRNFLGRTGSAAELDFWYGVLQQPNGLLITATGFTTATENRTLFVQSLFTTYLHRQGSGAEVANLVAQPTDLLSIQAEVLSSSEYFSNG